MTFRSVDLKVLGKQAEDWAAARWSEFHKLAQEHLQLPGSTREFIQRLIGAPVHTLEAFEPRTMMSADAMGTMSLLSTAASNAAIYVEDLAPLNTGQAAGAPASNPSSLTRLDKFRADPRFSGISGAGFSSVVIDTGISLAHSFFGPDANKNGVADRIAYQYDFADNDASASDVNGHGSNVASIVGSESNIAPGVAPKAGIIALKVFKDNGTGSFAYVEKALQWVVANVSKYNIASVNLSLGDNGNYQSNQQLYGLSDELASLARMNVIVVGAAGNSFFDKQSAVGVAYPAADPNVLGVGAVYASAGGGWTYGSGAKATSTVADQITPFSQRDSKLTPVFAPGAPMVGAGAKAGTTTSMHGTSQAAPFISGVAVLAQQLAQSQIGRRLTPGEFRDIVSSSGAKIVDGDDEKDNVSHNNATYKRVDVLALGQRVLDLKQTPANTAPTLNSSATLTGRAGAPLVISHKLLVDSTAARDAQGDAITFRLSAVSSGTMFQNGKAVAAGATLRAGEVWQWQPAAKASGTVNAFSITASDGKLNSNNSAAIRVGLSAAGGAIKSSSALESGLEVAAGSLSLMSSADSMDSVMSGGVAAAVSFRSDVSSQFLTFGSAGSGSSSLTSPSFRSLLNTDKSDSLAD